MEECQNCDGSGIVDVRHPELDEDLKREVWLTEFCGCEEGQQKEARYENAEEAIENQW